MNGFEKHNIDHSSASSINMWCNAPCAWVAKYLYQKKFSFGPPAKAGLLVEGAVVNVIANGWTEDKAIESVVKEYNKLTSIGASNADIKRGEALPEMIKFAINELKEYGNPEFDETLTQGKKQKKIELICNGDGWKLPIIGYLDFHWPKHGLVVDLKTTLRSPSVMSVEHTRQGSIYRKAMGNCTVKFLYVTGKKSVWHEIEDPKEVLSDIKSILNRQEVVLRSEAEHIKSTIPVMAESYYWAGDLNIRKELYGI